MNLKKKDTMQQFKNVSYAKTKKTKTNSNYGFVPLNLTFQRKLSGYESQINYHSELFHQRISFFF